ncbi:MAG TPA: Fe-S cluster assembly protein SufB [Clostridiales bacterium]|jgi:Fe-S cluster assembly protein SufB|nr:Fe-S cluster assembly protein SufB [Clostridiales bacterium]
MDDYRYGFNDGDVGVFSLERGLDEDRVRQISAIKGEPQWMTEFRVKSYRQYTKSKLPTWANHLIQLEEDQLRYYIKPSERVATDWGQVPEKIKKTFDALGLPEAEKKHLAGVATQYESEVVYQSIQQELEQKGVIFLDTDTALKRHPDLFRQYFGTLVPYNDNKYASLNSAVWSGGSFIYVPKGVKLEQPLQSYFRMNAEQMGQFERTLIIVDEGAQLHYVEGCTAPKYSKDSLHAAVVEIFVADGARCRYSTIQNWSDNVYNLVTKRAVCGRDAVMEWIDGNLGSKLTMKYPAIILKGEGAAGTTISIAVASKGQIQDAGSKMIHLAPNTSSTVVSKSIAKNGGNATYRGEIVHSENARHSFSHIECDTLILDELSKSDTIPFNKLLNGTSILEHEARVSKVSKDQLFYLMSRGLSEEQATEMIVLGFIEPFSRELPMEYAIELNQLLKMDMSGSIG